MEWSNVFRNLDLLYLVYFCKLGTSGQRNLNSVLQPKTSLPTSSISITTTNKTTTPPSTTTSSLSSPPPSPTPSSRRKQQQLLLITKGRSGSSYTSALITNNSNVFYSFEPLYALHTALLNTKERENYRERVQGLVKAYLTCDFMNISANDLNQEFHTRTPYGNTFLRCERDKNNGFAHIQCLSNMVKLCRSQRLSFSKLIRFPMRWAEPLLRQMPHLKILYLIRDPRAVIYSQASHFHDSHLYWPDGLEPNAGKFCNELKDDFSHIARLTSLFPGRLSVIRYENGATDPVTYAKEIYDFLGLEFTEKTRQYISLLQHGSRSQDNRAYGIMRSNSTDILNKWRHSRGGYKAARLIDGLCSDVYKTAGYIKITSENDLMSMTRPLFTERVDFLKSLKIKRELL